MSKQPFSFNTWEFLVLNGLGIACLSYYFLGGMPIFNTQIASELIPVQGVIDQNSLGKLSSTLFLIRQHYTFFAVELSTVPFLIFFIFSFILFSALFDSLTKSLYNLPEIILPVFLLSISAVHLFRRFVIKINLLQKMIIASILYSIFVLFYLIGRISGLVKYAWKFQ